MKKLVGVFIFSFIASCAIAPQKQDMFYVIKKEPFKWSCTDLQYQLDSLSESELSMLNFEGDSTDSCHFMAYGHNKSFLSVQLERQGNMNMLTISSIDVSGTNDIETMSKLIKGRVLVSEFAIDTITNFKK